MKLFYWPYQLKTLASLNRTYQDSERTGLLIKYCENDLTGFADLHPWPDRIATRDLLDRSLELARWDAQARSEGLSLVTNEVPIENHVLISDCRRVSDKDLSQWSQAGYHNLKIKMGRSLVTEQEWLNQASLSHFEVRLDFNQGFSSKDDYLSWVQGLKASVQKGIEFVEDPLPYTEAVWRDLFKKSPLPLAMDQLAAPCRDSFHVMVIKPTWQNPEKLWDLLGDSVDYVFTHSLDHPLGQAAAYALAQAWVKKGRALRECGLQNFSYYTNNPFHEAIKNQGPYLSFLPGLGFGFDEILNSLPWRSSSYEKLLSMYS